MAEKKPGDRLRESRERNGLTRPELAALTKVSASTIRAHENGQNNILPDVALLYSRYLGAQPSWLLYGHAVFNIDRTRDGELWTYDISGSITPGAFLTDKLAQAEANGRIDICLPKAELEAWEISGKGVSVYLDKSRDDEPTFNHYVIVREPGEDFQFGDSILIRRRILNLSELSIWKTGVWPDDSGGVRPIFFTGASLELASERLDPQNLGDATIELIGTVVARFSYKARQPPSWLPGDKR